MMESLREYGSMGDHVNIGELRALSDAATPGPWFRRPVRVSCRVESKNLLCQNFDKPLIERRCDPDGTEFHEHEGTSDHDIEPEVAGNYDPEDGGIINAADTAFIIAARSAVPALIDLVDELRAELKDTRLWDEVSRARAAAHKKHGEESVDALPLNDPRWLSILVEEIGEIATELHRPEVDSSALRAELVDVMALASAWLDAIDERRVGTDEN
ncbi:hypothetical protein [Lysinibacter sp. HNR]|uniref:hypothetical protein n=1 Tax=Lysinibacter sp. HNR TaxID=3031408 RepID=UPI002435BC31|nr:hypothetical protein [Lysinibacter sp. HNR]WGD37555.1 hypothetical protein FrondiHNR_01125 [Lysinibacter sp. HNR]